LSSKAANCEQTVNLDEKGFLKVGNGISIRETVLSNNGRKQNFEALRIKMDWKKFKELNGVLFGKQLFF